MPTPTYGTSVSLRKTGPKSRTHCFSDHGKVGCGGIFPPHMFDLRNAH